MKPVDAAAVLDVQQGGVARQASKNGEPGVSAGWSNELVGRSAHKGDSRRQLGGLLRDFAQARIVDATCPKMAAGHRHQAVRPRQAPIGEVAYGVSDYLQQFVALLSGDVRQRSSTSRD